jgi:hypothetical protein
LFFRVFGGFVGASKIFAVKNLAGRGSRFIVRPSAWPRRPQDAGQDGSGGQVWARDPAGLNAVSKLIAENGTRKVLGSHGGRRSRSSETTPVYCGMDRGSLVHPLMHPRCRSSVATNQTVCGGDRFWSAALALPGPGRVSSSTRESAPRRCIVVSHQDRRKL